MAAANKVPAFMFYVADFLVDENVRVMSNQQVGCYIKLLAFCWREGSIPSEVNKVARLCDETPESMETLWEDIRRCFVPVSKGSTRLTHPRLIKEREKQISNRSKRSVAGLAGAAARWKGVQIDPDGPEGGDGEKGGTPAAPGALQLAMDGLREGGTPPAGKGAQDELIPLPRTAREIQRGNKLTRGAGRNGDIARLVQEGVDPIVAESWVTTRRTKSNAPLTEMVLMHTKSEAAKAGLSFPDAVKYAAEHGWQGFESRYYFDVESKQSGQATGKPTSRLDSLSKGGGSKPVSSAVMKLLAQEH